MKRNLLAAVAALCLIATAAYAGTGQHEIINPNVLGATDAADFPSTCYLEADDVTNSKSIFIDCDEFLAVDGDTVGGDLTVTGETTLTDTANFSSAAILSTTFNPGVDVDTLDPGTIFFNSATNTVWFCSAGGCAAIAPE